MLDVAIRNGLVFDGSGRSPISADVGVSGSTIVVVGSIESQAAIEVDAERMYVTPGFIDIHSHSDYTLLIDARAVSSISQGVTTEVVGNCGFGCFPITMPQLASQAIYGFDGSIVPSWGSVDDYFETLSAKHPTVNVASLVPNGQLRISTGDDSFEQRSQRRRLLIDSLDGGASGFSVGLEYPIESATTGEELLDLCKIVARQDALFAAHTRRRDSGSVEAIREVLQLAEQSGVRLQISHLAPRSGIRDIERSLSLVEEARSRGVDVGFDMHTRLFGTTYLSSVLPSWSRELPRSELLRNLHDPAFQAHVRTQVPAILADRDWSELVLVDNVNMSAVSNRTIGELADRQEISADETVYGLLCEALTMDVGLMIMIPCYSVEEQDMIFSHPDCMPASDATALCPDGPLADRVFHGAYSWASWFWRTFVVDNRSIRPEEAVHRLTGMPARVMGWTDRGRLSAGARADIAVFDPSAYRNLASSEAPNQPAEGMAYVLVNGELVWTPQGLSQSRPGMVLA